MKTPPSPPQGVLTPIPDSVRKIVARPAMQVYTRVLYRRIDGWVDETGHVFSDRMITKWTPADDLEWVQR